MSLALRNMRFCLFSIPVALVATLGGCTDRSPAPADRAAVTPASTAADQSPVVASGPSLSAEPAKVEIIDEALLGEVLRQHRGKVVLVDFWATWCVECLELMPHTLQLRDRFGDHRLAVVLISLDSPEEKERIAAVLTSRGVDFPSYVSRYGMDPKSAAVFEIEGATLPNVKIFDGQGKLREVFASGRMPPEPFGPEEIEQAVSGIVGEAP